MGARTSLVWCLLAMLALAGVAPAYSMHEDQAGSYDWHKSFLGEATQAAFAGSKQNMRAFVSTEQGAIGAIEFGRYDFEGPLEGEPSVSELEDYFEKQAMPWLARSLFEELERFRIRSWIRVRYPGLEKDCISDAEKARLPGLPAKSRISGEDIPEGSAA